MLNPVRQDVFVKVAGLQSEAMVALIGQLGKGVPLAGTVIGKLPDGQTELQIGDRFVQLFIGREMEPGATFTARWVEGRLVLNMDGVASDLALHRQVFDAGIREPALEVAIRSLVQVLRDAGLGSDPALLTLARAFIAAGFPLSTDLLRELRRRVAALPGHSLPALTAAVSKGLPMNRTTLDLLDRIFRNPRTLPEALAEVAAAGTGLPADPAWKPVRDGIDELQRWTEPPEPLSPDGLKRQCGRFANHAEAALSRGESPEDVKSLLLRILGKLNTLEIGEGQSARSRDLGERLRSALDVITRCQIQNLPDQARVEDVQGIDLPVRLGDENAWLELWVRRDSLRGSGGGADDFAEILLRIRLSACGVFSGLLSRSGRSLHVRLSVEHRDTRERMAATSQNLQDALTGLGFSPVRVSVSRDAPE